MTVVVCRLHGGDVCMSHCSSCRHFDRLTWHCLYYVTHIRPLEEIAREERMRQEREERFAEFCRRWREVLGE